MIALADFLEKVSLQERRDRFFRISNWEEDAALVDLMYELYVSIKATLKVDRLHDWQREFLSFECAHFRENLLLCVPTNAGKTIISLMLILRDCLLCGLDCMLTLPYVALVYERVATLDMLSKQFNFAVDVYTEGKGTLPPRLRSKRPTVYVCVTEKALAVLQSLVNVGRERELGLVVVDEVHLMDCSERGSVLETFLAMASALSRKGADSERQLKLLTMSATVGNVDELSSMMRAKVFTNDAAHSCIKQSVLCRGVFYEVKDVKGTDSSGKNTKILQKVSNPATSITTPTAGWTSEGNDVTLLCLDAISKGWLTLVYCPTRRQCEALASNIATHVSKCKDVIVAPKLEASRFALCAALEEESNDKKVASLALNGVAYHHAGLSTSERVLIEEAFSSRVINIIVCTSTLAVGVNLPVNRVVVRNLSVGTESMRLSQYIQLIGRAGRSGLSDGGDSFVILSSEKDILAFQDLLNQPLHKIKSSMESNDFAGLKTLLMHRLVPVISNQNPTTGTQPSLVTMKDLQDTAGYTLYAVQLHDPQRLTNAVKACVKGLIESGCIAIQGRKAVDGGEADLQDSTVFVLTRLGFACVKGCVSGEEGAALLDELSLAARNLDLSDWVHILYLVCQRRVWRSELLMQTPEQWRLLLDWTDRAKKNQTSVVSLLQKVGFTEGVEMTILQQGRLLEAHPKYSVSQRLWVMMIMLQLHHGLKVGEVASTLNLQRGALVSGVGLVSSICAAISKFSEMFPHLWCFQPIMAFISKSLFAFGNEALAELLSLRCIGLARAKQLYDKGIRTLKDVAVSSPQDLTTKVTGLTLNTAERVVASAQHILAMRASDLRDDADQLKQPN